MMNQTLLALRLHYYYVEVLERLRRFKLIVFFILAMFVPTIALLMQVIQAVSQSIIFNYASSEYFWCILIFELIAMLWIGVQYDCLMLPDTENYLRTLKLPLLTFFVVECFFLLFINLPFLLLLSTCFFSVGSKKMFVFALMRFIYLTSSLFFLSVCVLYSQFALISLLLIMNIIFSHCNNVLIYGTLAGILFLTAYFVVIKKPHFRLLRMSLKPYFFNRALAKFPPKILLDFKILFVGNPIYILCILSLNLLAIFIFISYSLTQNLDTNLNLAFLIASSIIAYGCALAVYKLIEGWKNYGEYFSVYYTEKKMVFSQIISIYAVFILISTMFYCIGYRLNVSIGYMLITLILNIFQLPLFVLINRRLPSYGPIISLIVLFSISTIFLRFV